MLLYIEAADSLAHIAVGHTESALPARTLLLHTRAHFGKLKRSVGELVAQIGSCLGHIFPEVVVLDFAVGQGGKQIVGLLHSLGLGEDELLGSLDVHGLDEEAVPLDMRVVGLELVERAGIVHGGDIAALLAGEGGVGDCRLYLQDVLHDALCVFLLEAGVDHLVDDKLFVCVADL